MENSTISILVINDIEDNLIYLNAVLRESFPEAVVYSALSATQGVELAIENDPDVILVDSEITIMDCFDLCKKIKADSKLVSIPLVFVTALNSDTEIRKLALDCGVEAFLAKQSIGVNSLPRYVQW